MEKRPLQNYQPRPSGSPPLQGRTPSEKWEGLFHRLADALYARAPQSPPPLQDLRTCRIVSHRGEHDNKKVIENTLAAFDTAQRRKVWGIECDVRWTRDGVPVIFHDPTLRRLYGQSAALDEIAYSTLKRRFPLIPSLETVVNRYGKTLHLMIELKGFGTGPWIERQETLKQILHPLSPGVDFHLLSFFPQLLERLRPFPRHAFLPITRANCTQISRMCLRRGYAGLCGHYLLVSRRHIRMLRQHGLQVGTGFANSTNTLHREINRGVNWIFSEKAGALQRGIGRVSTRGRTQVCRGPETRGQRRDGAKKLFWDGG